MAFAVISLEQGSVIPFLVDKSSFEYCVLRSEDPKLAFLYSNGSYFLKFFHLCFLIF